jgi:ORF6N domain-containing protein
MQKSRTALIRVPVETIERRILSLRGHKVMIDSDLAEVFRVGTRALNQAVRRNRHRFPDDFMFRLTAREADCLRSQIVISKRGGRRYLPYAFTEHGAVMLASVLNSPAAVATSIQVVRAFVRLRTILAAHKELARKLDALEQKCDRQFRSVFETIREMLEPAPEPRRRPIGFALPPRKSPR